MKKLFILASLSISLLSVLGCQSSSRPTIQAIAAQTARVGMPLQVAITANNAGDLPITWDFTAGFAGLRSSATIHGDKTSAAFRWTPLASQVGMQSITIIAHTTAGDARQVFSVVVSAAQDTAPIFVAPGPGNAYPIASGGCVQFAVTVQDAAMPRPTISLRSAPPGAMLLGGDGHTFTGLSTMFKWCPTDEQLGQSNMWRVTFAADDGAHPATVRDHSIVLLQQPKVMCSGQPPMITVTAPSNGDSLTGNPGYTVTATVTDDHGLKSAPLLFYTTTMPLDLGNPDLTTFSEVAFGGTSPNYTATIPPLGLDMSTSQIVYFFVLASDDDDAHGTACDHQAKSNVANFEAFGGVSAGGGNACDSCISSSDCASGFCVESQSGDSKCLPSCEGPVLPCDRGTCQPLATAEGTSESVCGTVDVACGTVSGTCTDDAFEPNDSTMAAASISTGTTMAETCPNNDDYYALMGTSGDTVSVTLTITDPTVDLDLEMLDNTGSYMTGSFGSTSTESMMSTFPAAGLVYVHVIAYGTGSTAYTLDVTTTTPSTCTDDSNEPNDSTSNATPLASGPFSGQICAANPDYYTFDVTATEMVMITLDYPTLAGDLDIQLLDSTGAQIAISANASTPESINVSLDAGTYYLKIYGYEDGVNSYTGTISY